MLRTQLQPAMQEETVRLRHLRKGNSRAIGGTKCAACWHEQHLPQNQLKSNPNHRSFLPNLPSIRPVTNESRSGDDLAAGGRTLARAARAILSRRHSSEKAGTAPVLDGTHQKEAVEEIIGSPDGSLSC